jgi:8-oxo-dGTP pyrophosphatase MutT (NUDIX family)
MISSGLLITDGIRFLAELPLYQSPIDHGYDLPKGHVEPFDADYRASAFREAKEETGHDFDAYMDMAVPLSDSPVKYIKGKQIIIYLLKLLPEDMPEISEYHCDSFFADKKTGKQSPEVIAYEYKPLKEIRRWLFSSYGKTFDILKIFTE